MLLCFMECPLSGFAPTFCHIELFQLQLHDELLLFACYQYTKSQCTLPVSFIHYNKILKVFCTAMVCVVDINICMPMTFRKTAVTPLLTHWSYYSLALCPRWVSRRAVRCQCSQLMARFLRGFRNKECKDIEISVVNLFMLGSWMPQLGIQYRNNVMVLIRLAIYQIKYNVYQFVFCIGASDNNQGATKKDCHRYMGICAQINTNHDGVIKWKHFPRYWPFVRGINGHWWIPRQRPVTRSFDVRLNKKLSKQSLGQWFETISGPLWRQCNDSTL